MASMTGKPTDNGVVIRVEGVHKRYPLGGETVHALRGVSLELRRGEFLAVMGASGSGKTTLLHLIGGLDLPDEGRIRVDDQDLTQLSDRERTLLRRRRMGVVFQSFNLLPHLTAAENIAVPMLVDDARSADIAERVGRMLRQVRLERRAGHRPDALSGGEQQRVAIARALLSDPAVLLADEPTGNLDPENARQVLTLLRNLAAERGTTVMMVTHEAAAAALADRVMVLRDGQIIGGIDTEGRGDAALVATRYAQLAG